MLDEWQNEAVLSYWYPPQFQNLVSREELRRYDRDGLADRAVGFSVAPGPVGRLRFIRYSQPDDDLRRDYQPDFDADVLAHIVVRFLGYNEDPPA